MAYYNANQFTLSFNEEKNERNNIDDSVVLSCEGIPRQNWSSKCVVLWNASNVAIAKGICRNASFDVVVGSCSLLGDTHVQVQITSILTEANILDKWRYSI